MENILLKVPTIYEGWKAINDHFIYEDPAGAMVMAGRDFSMARYHVTLEAEHGFGIPDGPHLPLFPGQKRLDMLATRYIDPALWEEGIARLLARRDRSTGTYPASFLIQFHRRETSERKVPAGGGCLVGLNFTWFQKRWHLHLLSRASEITARLLSDIYFAEQCVQRVVQEAQMKKWDPTNAKITWTLLLPSQMKYMVPLYQQLTRGDKAVFDYMKLEPANPWHAVVREHFWTTVIHPETISWAQRRKWSEKFLDWSSLDWAATKNNLFPDGYPVTPKKRG